MPLQNEVARAEAIVQELEADVTRCIALLAIWDRANGKKDIKERYNHTFEARALSIIHDSLHITMIMALMRMYDRDDRSASIPSLISILEKPGVLGYLKQKSRPQRENIDTWMRSVKLRVARLRNDDTLKALKRLRNFTLAHIDPNKAARHGAKYGYERRILNRTAPIIRLFLLIVSSTDTDFSEVRKIWRFYAQHFWGSAAKGPKLKVRRPKLGP